MQQQGVQRSRQSRQSTEAKIENDINTRPGHETFLSPSTTVIKLNNCQAK